MPLIRYPGSKAKLTEAIGRFIPMRLTLPLCWGGGEEYRDPFFGSGAIGFDTLGRMPSRASVWLNDIDQDLVALWQSVKDQPSALCKRIMDFKPTTEAFQRFKATDGDGIGSPLDRGFRKLALHQMSFSGLGAMAGGPIGGIEQDENDLYQVGCRYTPETLVRHVQDLHKEFSRFADCRITCLDFSELLQSTNPDAFVYLDPPYYEKGPQLYRHSFTDADHERLAGLLKTARFEWVLSYDDHPRIRELYSWAKFDQIEITYTSAIQEGGKRPKNREVVITARP